MVDPTGMSDCHPGEACWAMLGDNPGSGLFAGEPLCDVLGCSLWDGRPSFGLGGTTHQFDLMQIPMVIGTNYHFFADTPYFHWDDFNFSDLLDLVDHGEIMLETSSIYGSLDLSLIFSQTPQKGSSHYWLKTFEEVADCSDPSAMQKARAFFMSDNETLPYGLTVSARTTSSENIDLVGKPYRIPSGMIGFFQNYKTKIGGTINWTINYKFGKEAQPPLEGTTDIVCTWKQKK